MKVYLVYAETYNYEEQTKIDYLQAVCSSMKSAQNECKMLATLMVREFSAYHYDAKMGVNEEGNIVVSKFFYGHLCEESHFTIEEREVKD